MANTDIAKIILGLLIIYTFIYLHAYLFVSFLRPMFGIQVMKL